MTDHKYSPVPLNTPMPTYARAQERLMKPTWEEQRATAAAVSWSQAKGGGETQRHLELSGLKR